MEGMTHQMYCADRNKLCCIKCQLIRLMQMQVRSKLPPGVDGWGYSLKGLMGMVVIGGLLITATYFFVQRTVVPK